MRRDVPAPGLLPEQIDAPLQVVTRANVVRAQMNFPQPVQPFDDPFAGLLEG